MEEDFFDVAVEGTTLSDCQYPEAGSRVIVLDRAGNYGTTYTALSRLQTSPYISGLVAAKPAPEKITVEALPFVLRPTNPLVQAYLAKPFGSELEYVRIGDVFFIDARSACVRLPNSKTDIVEMGELSNADRLLLHEAVRSRDIVPFKRHVIRSYSEDDVLYKIFARYNVFGNDFLARFGGAQFVYPVYGLGEISENISLTNSLNGYAYLLNSGIEMAEVSDRGEYRYRFTCEYGALYTKRFVRQQLREKTSYVRMLHVHAARCRGNFLAYLEADELVRIIGLDSKTKTCAPDVQILYFIKDRSPVSQENIEQFGVTHEGTVVDLAYKTVYDVGQFDGPVCI
ncbi:Rab GDP dissociation inhibitor [Pancytospora philotis]|nr:Rab GDP dissociation inhibitor [Pancytospora philotis]